MSAVTAVRLLLVALPVYFAWEMLQAPFFTGMPERWLAATAVCALATLGDGVLVGIVALAGALVYHDARWFAPPAVSRYAVVVMIGVGLQIGVEWVMVHRLERWGYASSQPVLPGVEVGVLPVLQAMVLLPLVFRLTAWWESSRR